MEKDKITIFVEFRGKRGSDYYDIEQVPSYSRNAITFNINSQIFKVYY
jgi:hypothetical protein